MISPIKKVAGILLLMAVATSSICETPRAVATKLTKDQVQKEWLAFWPKFKKALIIKDKKELFRLTCTKWFQWENGNLKATKIPNSVAYKISTFDEFELNFNIIYSSEFCADLVKLKPAYSGWNTFSTSIMINKKQYTAHFTPAADGKFQFSGLLAYTSKSK